MKIQGRKRAQNDRRMRIFVCFFTVLSGAFVFCVPAMSSALFAVSIDTSLGLVWLQIASLVGCAANSSSTDQAGQNTGSANSES